MLSVRHPFKIHYEVGFVKTEFRKIADISCIIFTQHCQLNAVHIIRTWLLYLTRVSLVQALKLNDHRQRRQFLKI